MKVTFKADKYCADDLILGLAKSGIPVSAAYEEEQMIRRGNCYITAEFPDEEEKVVVDTDLYGCPTTITTGVLNGII